MTMIEWLRRLLIGPRRALPPPDVIEHEAQIVERIAAASGRTPAQVREAARRRALRLEVESLRRVDR
jgi:hypothetical protein